MSRVELLAYRLLVPLRRLFLTGEPFAQTVELSAQPGHLLAQLAAFRAQGVDRGLPVLHPLQGRTQPAALLVGQRPVIGLRLAVSMPASSD